MMGPRQVAQGALFYEFSLEAHVPADHLLRQIDQDGGGRNYRPQYEGPCLCALGRGYAEVENRGHRCLYG